MTKQWSDLAPTPAELDAQFSVQWGDTITPEAPRTPLDEAKAAIRAIELPEVGSEYEWSTGIGAADIQRAELVEVLRNLRSQEALQNASGLSSEGMGARIRDVEMRLRELGG